MKGAIETLLRAQITPYGLAWLCAWVAVVVPLLVGLCLG